jgi:hypothetical protein
MSNEIIRTSLDEKIAIAKLLAKSGYFASRGDSDVAVAQLVSIIIAGEEMGMRPFTAVNSMHIISGKPAPSAHAMASAIKASGKYDYRIRTLTNELCEIEFYERNSEGRFELRGVSTFSSADARAAGTKNMKEYPRNMLEARALSNGFRWFCPDVFNGNVAYLPEELGAVVDGEGNVIEQPTPSRQLAVSLSAPAPAPAPAPEPTDVPAEVGIWTSPTDAYQWAVDIGASETVADARAAFSQLVQTQFGGKLTAGNKTAALAAFHADRMAKLSAASIELDAVDEIPH